MKAKLVSLLLLNLILFMPAVLMSQNTIPSPSDYFGFEPGAEGQLFTYEKAIDYFKELDKASDKFHMIEVGETPMGKPMYLTFTSSEENIKNLDKLKLINKELALNTSLSKEQQANLVKEGKVFVYATLSMHANEVGPAQAAPQIAYNLVTSTDKEVTNWLNNVVYMMIIHNPDGMDMVVNNYLKYKGTKYEGASLPGVYHKYVGHDNNRDFIVLTQKDTKVINELSDKIWLPQVMFEKHQMGSTGVRYFVPPPHDPIAENIDAGLWNWMKIFGSSMISQMTSDSLYGVVQSYIFDDYWPGSTETCLWKNVIAMLTEAASAKGATSIYIEPNELSVGGKGLSEYKISINMPKPWPGGWWKLSDIVDYEQSSVKGILKAASNHKEEILTYRNELAVSEVERGKSEAPNYYILPLRQHDQSELVALVNLLKEHNISVYSLAQEFTLNNRNYPMGSIVIPLAQPYRAFIKEVMEKQTFPLRHYTPGGKIIKPYDITTWSLPLHKGLEFAVVNNYNSNLNSLLKETKSPFDLKTKTNNKSKYYYYTASENESYKAVFLALEKGIPVLRIIEKDDANNMPAGSFLLPASKADDINELLTISPMGIDEYQVQTESITLPKIALVESWFHDMDAGWTRYIFDTYHIPFTVIRPGDFEKTDFSKFDIVIFPDQNKNVLKEGKYSASGYYKPRYPAEFTKGMGKKGFEKLLTFENNGGTIISWGRSTDLFTGMLSLDLSKDEKEEFSLPFRNLGKSFKSKGLYCPGSLVKVNWKSNHPLTYGMQQATGVFYRGNPVFQTSQPGFDTDRRVIGTFPENDILMSGYAEKIDLVKGLPAMVWMKKGKGQFVMYAFSPIFRASTPVTYKLVFNALLQQNK